MKQKKRSCYGDILLSAVFLKNIKKLAKKYKSLADDLKELQARLSENPYAGVDLGNGVRKVRMSIKSKGKGKSKSGGARVIYMNILVADDDVNVTMLTVYDKSEQESISDNEINMLISSL